MYSGGYYGYTDKIYQYDHEVDEWVLAGRMKRGRGSHAVSVVSKREILQHCL